jgi:DNA-binding MarR family transcriptional regulator
MNQPARRSVGDAAWLDDDEMAFWRAFVDASGRAMNAIDADLRSDSGLTLDDYEVLVRLSEAPELRIRMSELADSVVQSRSRLTQRIDRMVERGLVARVRCPEDRRGTFAVLTDVGIDTLAAAAPQHVDSVRRHVIDHLDGGQLRAGADALRSIIDATDGDGLATP